MGKKSDGIIPQVITEPWEHVWTQSQIRSALDMIDGNKSYEDAFFGHHKSDNHKYILLEQEVCVSVLAGTDWINYMLQIKKVLKDQNGNVKQKPGETWPKKMRTINILINKLHSLAEGIKVLFGPSSNVDQLRKNNQKAYEIWCGWQKENLATWYFKYVVIKIRIFPKWLESKPSPTPPPLPDVLMKSISHTFSTKPSLSVPSTSASSAAASATSSTSLLYLIRKMHGTITRKNNTSNESQITHNRLDYTRYILWNSSVILDDIVQNLSADQDKLPTPITLIGLVQLVTAKRNIELQHKPFDLLSFED
ncbi:uncharacterized protein L201_006190 [Kwoniella dendrophila CBS 6074]|uniref:Uncharacterized protein n=1 Tax=Kwoniella dendrophila CBS 6074 TaxID=1295534 RepID=A0AAX4K109_9TREE